MTAATPASKSAPVQWALQVRFNAGMSSEGWDFDSDYDVRDQEALAWDDMGDAEDSGFRADDLRVVALTVLAKPTTPPGQADA